MMNKQQNGFTLLEVLIAITLTALVMGSVFSLQSQNSRLAVRSIEAIDKTVNRRAALNLAYIDVEMIENLEFRVENKKDVPKPEVLQDKLEDGMLGLESFDLLDENGAVMNSSVRLKKTKS